MTTADEIAEVPIEKLRDAVKDVADQLDVLCERMTDAVNDVAVALDFLRERMAAVINELASDIAENVEPQMFEDYQPVPVREVLMGAVIALLTEVERPAGTRRPSLPDTPGARKALLALYDAVGREKPE